MDFLLPDDGTMALMREEYERAGTGDMAHAFALSLEADILQQSPSPDCVYYLTCQTDAEDGTASPFVNVKYILLLYLYFGGNLRYNGRYGTSIYDTDGGVGGLRPVSHAFGKLNNLR